MKKKLLVFTAVMVMVVGLSGCGNLQNKIGDEKLNSIEWFKETGISVQASTGKVYYIVQDPNGWLYYYNSPEGDIEAVRDVEGHLTKDVSMFQEDRK